MNKNKFVTWILGISLAVMFLISCSLTSAVAQQSTYTPYPTFTPLASPQPASTSTSKPLAPAGSLFSVKVISATKSLSFGTWSYDPSQNSNFLIVSLQYTNNSSRAIEFFPASVELLFPDGSRYAGDALLVSDYQPATSTEVANFTTETPPINTIQPGQTLTEEFGWGIVATNETNYTILFPGTSPINITATQGQ